MQPKSLSNGTSVSHPILNCSHHPVIDFFKAIIEKQYSLTSLESNLPQILNKLIFEGQDYSQLKQKYRSLNISFDVVCGKIIPKKCAYYCCLDCDKVSKEEKALVGIMCQDCFINSNHEGHRVIMGKNKYNVSLCYCGDSSIFDQSGFCKEHSKKSITFEDVKEKLGADFVDNFIQTLKITLYGICSLLEIYEKGRDQPKRFIVKETLTVLLEQCLEFCNKCSSELSSIFFVILSQIFIGKFPAEYNKFMHYCSDLKGKKGLSPTEIVCTCSIAELLIKNIAVLDSSHQLLYLFRNLSKDYEFRQFMAVTFVKYLHYIFLNDDPKRRSLTVSHARFASTSSNFYTNNELCEIAIRSGYTIHIFEILQDTLLKCTCLQGRFNGLVTELRTLFQLMMRPYSNSSKLLLKNNYTLIVLIELLSGFQQAHYYTSPFGLKMSPEDVNYNFINDSLECEGLVISLARRAIIQLDELDERDREMSFTKLCLYWKETYDQSFRKDKKSKYLSFHPVLERLLPHLIRGNSLEVPREKIYMFIKNKLDSKPEVIAERVLEGLVKPLGALKLIEYLSESSSEKISRVYHDVSYNLFDNDILTIQMMSMIIPPNVNLFSLLVKNFFSFSKEIAEFILEFKVLPNEDIQKFAPLIEDFFRWLLYLMTDETCLVNNVLTRDPKVYAEQFENSERIKKIRKRVLTNILSCYTWIDLPELLENVKSVLYISNLDETLGEVAIFDEKLKKMRIKEDCFQDYDPYLFYARKKLNNQLKQLFLEKMKKSMNVDLLSGFYYTDLPEFLYDLQVLILQGPIIDFLSKFFIFGREELKPLTRICLKMLLFILNTTEHLLTKNKDISRLLGQVNDNLQSSYLKSKITALKEDPNFSDCEIIIENIIECSDRLTEIIEYSPQKAQERPLLSLTEKRAQSELKQKQLQENFIRKSTDFFQKTKFGQIREHEGEEEEDEYDDDFRPSCSVCLEAINNDEKVFGVPVLITLTNQVGKTWPKVI